MAIGWSRWPFLFGWAVGVRELIFVLMALAATGVGCGRRAARDSLPNLVIPIACASEITLMRCDVRVNPPRCKSARVSYRGGCEQIAVRQ
jgi:hypothetical protein